MIVFKTFLKVLNKNKGIILLYTLILLIFAYFNMKNGETTTNFSSEKTDVYILLEDENIGLTKNLVDYLKSVSLVKEIKEEKLEDALFYRDVSMIIKIPKNYRIDTLNGINREIEIQSTGDYTASLEKMLLEKYLRIQKIYLNEQLEETKVIEQINETLNKKVTVELTSTLDRSSLSKAKLYFNFSNYAILAGLVFVICLMLTIFKEEKIKKRTLVSSLNYKKYNRILFLSNGLFTIILWLLYVLLGFVLIGKTMLSYHGLFFMINSFIFSMCALSIALLIGNVSQNKEALSGIVNVVALGSSFLCGAFVPMEFLPKSVVKISHVLPSYWFIKNNDLISNLEQISLKEVHPIITNFAILIGFIIIFSIGTNLISKKKLKQS